MKIEAEGSFEIFGTTKKLHCIISQKTTITIFTMVRTSDLEYSVKAIPVTSREGP
jgi:hypothetical protein